MIDPSMTNVLLESPDAISLPMALQKIEARDQKIAELEKANQQLENTLNNYRQLTALSETRVENLRDWLIENADGSIDKRTAEDIAEIMDIELVKDYYFDVVVRFTGAIQIGMGDEAEDILADAHFDMINYGGHEFHVDAEIEEINITDYN